MVKYLFPVLIVCFAACSEQVPVSGTEKAFDTQPFELDSFTERVRVFLQSREETQGLTSYAALFVNTENCSSCMRTAFEDIGPYLAGTEVKTFVYMNDSGVARTHPGNALVRFVYLPKDVFKSAKIFHSNIYLYSIRHNRIQAVRLSPGVTDSLNNLR